MNDAVPVSWSVFTKPWPDSALDALGEKVRTIGFDSVELPVRPGFQVTPETVRKGLPAAVRTLADAGVRVASIASSTGEEVFAACADAGVGVIRIMVPVSRAGYSATLDETKRRLEALSERAERYGVRVGVQPHYDDFVADSTSLFYLLRDYEPGQIGAIWDAAHDALARKHPEHGLELLWPWLLMANLKSASYTRIGDHDRGDPVWEPVFTDARSGMAQWGRAIDYLRKRRYCGTICLTAEYSDESGLEAKLRRDLEHAKQLYDSAGSPREGEVA